jgi:hypothetical protein
MQLVIAGIQMGLTAEKLTPDTATIAALLQPRARQEKPDR